MEAFLGKTGKRLFEKHLEQYKPEDPLYEFYTDAKGRTKRRKRATPLGLSARDAKILQSVQRRAHHLDKGFSIFGLRFGWTFFTGLIPLIGDAANVFLDYQFVVKKAQQADIPPWLLQRMLFHVIVGASVGFIPAIGDVFVAVYKPNSRNAGLLSEFLRIRGEEYMRLQAGEVAAASGSNQAKGKGARKSDLQRVTRTPGSGIPQGEIIQIPTTAVSTFASDTQPPAKRSFGFLGLSSTHAETISPPA